MIEVEPFSSILPFFALSVDCHYWRGKKGDRLTSVYELPLLSTSGIGKVFLGWNEEGIFLNVEWDKKIEEVYFPDFKRGESVELFFDTRDGKKGRSLTRFCHHFVFLPRSVEVNDALLTALEITTLRAEEKRESAPPDLLFVETEEKRKGALTRIFIAREALHGFDPSNFDKMGFSYRINAYRLESQDFTVSSRDFALEHHPSLWASLTLLGRQ